MANKKKLTEEQESQIKILLANNEMLEKTKKEAKERGKKIDQIVRAQQEVVDHINAIDPSALDNPKQYTPKKEKKVNNGLFDDTDMSLFDILNEREAEREVAAQQEAVKEQNIVEQKENNYVITPSDTVINTDSTFSDSSSNVQYDVIQLPSNGQCYKSKIERVPVAYLTAYDENIITSPNLYKDGLVIDFLLKNKIVNKEINPDDLISGDVDAITLFLRATSYGADFPIVVTDPDTGEQIESIVDLTTLKPRDFTLIGDENGWFDFETPGRKDKIKFRYLTRKMEKQLQKANEIENYGTKAYMLDMEREILGASLLNDKILSENDKKTMRNAIAIMGNWSKKLRETNQSKYNKLVTNSLQMQIMSVNGNTDRDYIRQYIGTMPAMDALALRKYIEKNRPGINFDIEVKRPESLGGGSFKTFLNWDDSIFLNIPDL
jgi:hypothetical protein